MRRCNRAAPNGNSCSHQRPLLLPVLTVLLQQPQQLPTAHLPPLPLRHLRVSLLATRTYRLRERVETSRVSAVASLTWQVASLTVVWPSRHNPKLAW